MNKTWSHKIIEIFKVVIVVAVLTIGVSYALADWTAPRFAAPTCPPGDSGCEPPIDVSSVNQVKAGGVGLGGFFSARGSAVIGHGTDAPTIPASLKLRVAGRVGASAYCDQNGENCIVPPGGSGGVVAGTCPSGQFVRGINANGTLNCAKPSGGGGFSLNLGGILGGGSNTNTNTNTQQTCIGAKRPNNTGSAYCPSGYKLTCTSYDQTGGGKCLSGLCCK